MKKSYLKLALSVVFALALGLSSCTKEKATGRIQGIVTNMNTTEPIQGVNISLSPTGASAVTGSDGRYEFNNLEAGNYTVQGVKAGFESNTKNISITAGNVSSGDMQLRPTVSGFRLNVEYLDFSTNFSQLQFKIINASATLPLSWEIMESMNWMTVTPSTGNLQGGQEVTVMVNIDRSLITQSTSANLTVRSADQSIVLPINVSVSGSYGPQLALSEATLDFGTSASTLMFYVMNTGPSGTSLNWVCSNITVDWLTLSLMSGVTAGGSSTQVTATIDRTKISGMVTTSVTFSGAGTSTTLVVSAAESGSGSPILQLSDGSLNFGTELTTLTFQVKNVGTQGTVLNWNIPSPTEDWLTVAPLSGNTNAGSGTTVTVAVDRTKFNGSVSANINVNSSNANNSSISVSAEAAGSGGSVVVPEGLLAYYTFDDGTANDWHGNVNAINMGCETSTDTPTGEGYSMEFNGTSSSLSVPSILPTGNAEWAINVWIKTGSNNSCFIASENRYMGVKNSKILCGGDGAGGSTYTTTATISQYLDFQWHMVTLSYNKSKVYVYMDGMLVEIFGSSYCYWNKPTINIGAHYSQGIYYSGKMDNFRSYNRALTASEIQTLYNAKQ